MPSSSDLTPLQGSYLLHFLKSQLFVKGQPPPKDMDLTGQTAIVTGSNSGLGFECARILLNHQLSRIILAVRSTQKGNDAATELQNQHPTLQIEVWSLGMLNYRSIQAFVQRCAALDRIDFVILNAGLTQMNFQVCEGTRHEETFQVNYLSTALLTILLLPILKEKRAKDKPSRITLVSSSLAMAAKFTEQDAHPLIPAFDDRTGWNMAAASERYSTSKLLCQMFVAKLKDFVNADSVVVNLVEPGMIRSTGLDRSVSTLVKSMLVVFRRLLGRTVQFGAWLYIDAAVLRGKETHGSVLDDWKVVP